MSLLKFCKPAIQREGFDIKNKSNLPCVALVKLISRFSKKHYHSVLYRICSLFSLERSIRCLHQELNIKKNILVKLDLLTHYLTVSSESSEPFCGKYYFQNYFVRNGDWDKNLKQIKSDYYRLENNKNAVSYRSSYQIFQYGIPYQDCDEYKKKLQGEVNYIKTSAEELDEKYQELKNLFNLIKKGGYKSQIQLGKRSKHWNDEIRVAIGRDGELLKIAESGNHRLAIAQILNIEYVPVYIQGVHYDWAVNCHKKHGCHILLSINKELGLIAK